MTESGNRFGLTTRDMETIRSVFENYPEVKTVHLFGSRAKGSYRFGSDIDLAVMNKGIDGKKLAEIKSDFEESSLPYNVDLVDFTRLEKQEFIDHVERVGVPFFSREEQSVL